MVIATAAVTIRPARVDEREALEGLQWRASLANPGDRDALLAHPDAVALPDEQIEQGGVFVAEAGGRLRGWAALLPRADGNVELDGLFVEPDAWKSGIGSLLVEHCAGQASSSGASFLHVVGNPHAESFYRKRGFQYLGEQSMTFGVGLLMRRPLR